MHLTLLVPGLLLPEAIRSDMLSDLATPALSRLIGQSHRQELPDGALSEIFGIPSQLPAAALRKVDAGGTAQGEWLCLDPVHLDIGRDGITLANPATLQLGDEENAALLSDIAPVFAAWGELSASSPGHWEMALSRSAELLTRPLADGIGDRVDAGLPGGQAGRDWRALLLEAQTLLHRHPINLARESEGRPTINSLWVWGQGRLPDRVQTDRDEVWSQSRVIAGLATLAGIACQPAPECFTLTSSRVLAHDTRLTLPANTQDALLFRENLLTLERDWLAPAVTALSCGDCRSIQLIGTGRGLSDVAYVLTRPRLWQFWRRPKPLQELG